MYTFAAMALFTSCSKDNGNPLSNDSTIVSFPNDRIGLAELYEFSFDRLPAFTITKATPNRAFSYSVTGSNGMKNPTDTLLQGHGSIDADGAAAVFLKGLINCKDGEITVVIKMENPATTITAKVQKAELEIRSYKDFMHMASYNGNDTTYHYVQLNDFAFPDTVFSYSPAPFIMRTHYDGQGHRITNLTIKAKPLTPTSETATAALFSSLLDGVSIRNVKLELSEEGISSDTDGFLGGLVGGLNETSSIINCSVKGNVLASKDKEFAHAGGIAGYAHGARIIGCSFRGKLSGRILGGIVAASSSEASQESKADETVIDMCYAYAEFDGASGGGIAGDVGDVRENYPAHVTITNSYLYATTFPATFEAIAPVDPIRVAVSNCFANTGGTQNGVTIALLANMNTLLAAMEISNWPQGVSRPANNKPYKNDTDPAAPMKLWWE
ncbi:GLUG motif-containing protein [Chitinophaga sp. S165]|nr:GLUG motif-containing protein [Chitinophaga sp. S165]